MTNGDKIRQMSDEELADYLRPERPCLPCRTDPLKTCMVSCMLCQLKWLQEEVQEDG